MKKFSLCVFLLSFLMLSCSEELLSPEEEEAKIEAYIKNKNLTVTEKTSSGLRYIRQEESTGASLKAGQYITVNYTGKLLSDKQFDSGTFGFYLGAGSVIRGFDEGVAKMKIGEKAILIFPSSIGYGYQGSGKTIPPNTPLLFEIEVVSAK